MATSAALKIDEIITSAFRDRDRTFGNARFVFDLIEKAKINLGLRIMGNEDPRGFDKADLAIIQLGDVDKIALKKKVSLPAIPVDQALLSEALSELDSLIGLEKVKTEIKEMAQLVAYYRRSGRNVLHHFSLHTVFVGNPGTGKTTVARILAKIYKALGILERGHMIETDRQGLVAGYMGQTATKTAAKLDEAVGGVLFIDEAYALTQRSGSHQGDFGDEAIQTILKRMEDQRGKFFIFAAGYPDNMNTFLKANPGLSSRFDRTLKFEDYDATQLLDIAKQMLLEKEQGLSPAAERHLGEYLQFLHKFRDKFFGNARAVRQVVMKIIKAHDLRLAEKDATGTSNSKITLQDVEVLKMDKNELNFTRSEIGFRR